MHSKSVLQDAIHSATGIFWRDESSSGTKDKPTVRDEVEHYAGELVKAVPLFLASSKGAYAASALLYGLDQVHIGDSTTSQLADFGLGATKGALTKGSFDLIGKKDWGIAAKGLGLGVSSRLLDVGLTRQTYFDKTGELDLLGGAKKTAEATFAPKMLATDVLVFGAAHGLFKGMNAATAGALERSPLLQTVGTGGTFGFVSGAGAEMQRQTDSHEKFDPVKVVLRGFLQAGVTSVAAVPGGMQMSRMHSAGGDIAPVERPASGGAFDGKATPMSLRVEPSSLAPQAGLVDTLARTSEVSNRGDATTGGGREFRIIDGQDALAKFRRGENRDGALLKVREKLDSGEGIERTLFVQHQENGFGINANLADLVATCNGEKLPQELAGKHVLPGEEGKIYMSPGSAPENIIFANKPLARSEKGAWEPVELGSGRFPHTPAEMLERADHHLSRIANAVAEDPILSALRVTGMISDAGYESVVMRLDDGRVLKFVDPVNGQWHEEWGHRPYDNPVDAQGSIEFSDLGDINWYIAKELTPLSRGNLDPKALEEFWSRVPQGMDPWDVREGQLGYDEHGRLWLLDYSAIAEEGEYINLADEMDRVRQEENEIDLKDPKADNRDSETGEGFEVVDGLQLSPEQKLAKVVKQEQITNEHDKFLLDCMIDGGYTTKDLVQYAEALYGISKADAKTKVTQLQEIAKRHDLLSR